MPDHSVSLTDDQHRFIGEAVSAGRYPNASEAVREGLRLLERRDAREASKLARFKMLIAEGESAYTRGEYEVVPPGRTRAWLDEVDTQERETALR